TTWSPTRAPLLPTPPTRSWGRRAPCAWRAPSPEDHGSGRSREGSSRKAKAVTKPRHSTTIAQKVVAFRQQPTLTTGQIGGKCCPCARRAGRRDGPDPCIAPCGGACALDHTQIRRASGRERGDAGAGA